MKNVPAFPVSYGDNDSLRDGMTLRDYLVTHFLAAGIIARAQGVGNPDDMVEDAFFFADRVLARRHKG